MGSVVALLVSHDGGRWLPQVLERLHGQTVPPTSVVAVDTGSRDGSAALLRDSPATGTVLELDRGTGFPAAVRAGLATLDPGGDDDWIWLLHDDSAPAPDALERLLAARAPSEPDLSAPDVLGPKIREWPSLRRILEVGVTVTGTAQRETGLERGEYDQGQHDEPRDVLAVNTAGMLVRRSVLERLGFDDELPLVHTDLDFGWRAARGGLRVRTVPDAVVFHAEATRAGTRDADQTRPARRRAERAAAVYTVLANCSPAAVPFVAVRLLLGGCLRALGLLLVRAPGEAWAELRALGATLARPGRLARARASRRESATVGAREVRPLLAPAWLPYRHGLDELVEIGAAVVGEAGAKTGTTDGRPSLRSRLLRSPTWWLLVATTLVSLVAARRLLGDGPAGGALLPAPGSAVDWWRDYLSTTHDLATGSSVTAPAYLLPLALAATVLVGSAAAVLWLLVLLVVPVAAVGGARFVRRVTGSPIVSVWAGAGYGLLLATSGALAQGRLGTLVAGAVLPWLASAALGLGSASADERRRAAWRCALGLAVAGAFAPIALPLAAVVTVGALLLLALTGRFRLDRVAPALVPVPAAALLLMPWTLLVWADRGWSSLVLEAGLPASGLIDRLGAGDVLGARAAQSGAAPVWVAAATVVLALLALLRSRTRRGVVLCWFVALVGLAGVWVTSSLAVDDPTQGGTVWVWSGLPLLLLHGAWLTAAALAAVGLRASVTGRAFGWRQPAGLLVVALGLVLPVCGTVWWLGHGSDEPLGQAASDTVPAYMTAAGELEPADGTLVLRGSLEKGISAELRRGSSLTLGEEKILPSAVDQASLTGLVADLVSAPKSTTTEELASEGVAFIFVPEPVDADLASALDGVPGLAGASADDPVARAWRLDEPRSLPAVDVPWGSWARPLLLVLQAIALVVVVVLAAPTRRRTP